MKTIRNLGLSAIMVTLAACGGGSDGGGDALSVAAVEVTPKAGLSFYPLEVDAEGIFQEDMVWRYEINDGRTLSSSIDGVEVALDLSLYEVRSPVDGMQLQTRAEGDVEARAAGFTFTGDYTLFARDYFLDIDGETYVNGGDLSALMTLGDGADSITLKVSGVIRSHTPMLWFLDREDLDELAVGYSEGVETTASAWVAIEDEPSSGMPPYGPYQHVSLDYRWEIVAKHDSYLVNGASFSNVVEVEMNYVLPSTDAYEIKDVTSRLWLAKNIGLIRSTGYSPVADQDAVVELVYTNLSE